MVILFVFAALSYTHTNRSQHLIISPLRLLASRSFFFLFFLLFHFTVAKRLRDSREYSFGRRSILLVLNITRNEYITIVLSADAVFLSTIVKYIVPFCSIFRILAFSLKIIIRFHVRCNFRVNGRYVFTAREFWKTVQPEKQKSTNVNIFEVYSTVDMTSTSISS